MLGTFLKSLRFRLSVMTLVATLLVVLGLVFLLDRAAVREMRNAADLSLQYETQALVARITTAEQDCAVAAENLAAHPDIVSMNVLQQRNVLQSVPKTYRNIASAHVLLPDGTFHAGSSDVRFEIGYPQPAWFRTVIGGNVDLHRAAFTQHGQKAPVTLYAKPMHSDEGHLLGVICVTYEPQEVLQSVTTPRLGQTGLRIITDERGRVLAHQDAKFVQQFADLSHLPIVRRSIDVGSTHLNFARADDDRRWMACSEKLANGWIVVTMQSEDEVLAQVRSFRDLEVLIVGAVGVLVALIVWLIASYITNPIAQLAALVGSVDAQRLAVRAAEKGPGEVRQLAESFNHMISELEKAYREIEGKVEQRTQMLNLRNAELLQASQIAKRDARLKDEFLANISHEIRTPLTAILGYAELLVDLQMSEDDRSKALQSIQSNGNHLLGIINDLLDIAKLDAEKMEVEPSEFPVVALINDVVSLIRSKAIAKEIRLEVDFGTKLPELIISDPTRLRQILLNLLSNAVKYTHQGRVRLLTRLLQPADSEEAYLQFDVIDTGIGMTDEHLAKLFQPFAQGCVSTARKYGGTGLGLVISKRLSKLLGGDITVATKFGMGSTFTLVVPIGKLQGRRMMDPEYLMHDAVAAIPLMDDRAMDLTGVRVLLAEDNATNAELLSRMLTSTFATVTRVENGRKACHEAMEAFQAGHAFDMIIMDMHMPELDGAAATARLRQLGYPGPIVVLTSGVESKDHARSMQAGASDFGHKPIEREKLIGMISRLCGRQPLHNVA